MRTRTLSSLILILAFAQGARAADNDDAQGRRGPQGTLFLSPAGKPFHGMVGQPYPVAAWFAEADADHDGKLTRDEFRADFAAFFKQLDTNGDGAIDGVEIADYEQHVAPEVLPRVAQEGITPERAETPPGQTPGQGPGPGGGRRRGGGGMGGGGQGGGMQRLAQAAPRKGQVYDGAPEFSLQNVSEPVSGADGNFDGKVTLEEYLAAADRRFAALDKDGQGYLTLGALPKTPEQKAAEKLRKKAADN